MDDANATHSVVCPIEGCDKEIKTHAHSDEEAVTALAEATKSHAMADHPDQKLSDEELEKTTKEGMKTHGHQAH